LREFKLHEFKTERKNDTEIDRAHRNKNARVCSSRCFKLWY